MTYADIELTNSDDVAMVRRNIISESEVKRMRVNMLVDSGAYNMCINENIQAQLQLPFIEKRTAELSDGSLVEYDVVGPVEVRFKNRTTTCRAFVLPGNTEPLLGAIPMEDMDVLIHPQRQELILPPDRPYMAQMKLK